MYKKDFIDTNDFTKQELLDIIDLSLALAGWSTGGPAKVAVVSSGLMGTVSGSSVANVCTTGMFTIPLMKSVGYEPYFAGAVEAVASTGGQIMPPVMGAAAFIMAQILGVPYIEVAIAAVVPALLYYFAVMVQVHFEACRLGLRGIPWKQLPAQDQGLPAYPSRRDNLLPARGIHAAQGGLQRHTRQLRAFVAQ